MNLRDWLKRKFLYNPIWDISLISGRGGGYKMGGRVASYLSGIICGVLYMPKEPLDQYVKMFNIHVYPNSFVQVIVMT